MFPTEDFQPFHCSSNEQDQPRTLDDELEIDFLSVASDPETPLRNIVNLTVPYDSAPENDDEFKRKCALFEPEAENFNFEISDDESEMRRKEDEKSERVKERNREYSKKRYKKVKENRDHKTEELKKIMPNYEAGSLERFLYELVVTEKKNITESKYKELQPFPNHTLKQEAADLFENLFKGLEDVIAKTPEHKKNLISCNKCKVKLKFQDSIAEMLLKNHELKP
eukprot:snap_masked-scaffold_13-processed-gene-5.26-mRNA-1 protein AED:1.00 eAED:1.00 QI:0/-1/0/0/-1/1/1/0/224